VATTLRDESTGGGGRGPLTLRNTLVVALVAGFLVLLITRDCSYQRTANAIGGPGIRARADGDSVAFRTLR
jgi:hypothetical protein